MNEIRTWQSQIKEAIRSIDELVALGYLEINETSLRAGLDEVAKRYPLFITQHMLSLVGDDLECPIRLQVIPSLEELKEFKTQRKDPIGDLVHRPVDRITHRYEDRALFHLTDRCPIHCRYCFRKNLLNDPEVTLFSKEYEKAFQYLERHKEIQEVIFTGGDPLFLSNERLNTVLSRLDQLSHLKGIRFHTRFLVSLPDRFDEEFLTLLENSSKAVTFVHHLNHLKEWSEKSRLKQKLLNRAGARSFSQSVLLRGVNDHVETLKELFSTLYFEGVTPLYLHHPDPSQGTAQFQMSLEEGQEIVSRLRGQIPGPAMPTYVFDRPGGYGKRAIPEQPLEELKKFQ
jgi:lysine 2,3-aminomutase